MQAKWRAHCKVENRQSVYCSPDAVNFNFLLSLVSRSVICHPLLVTFHHQYAVDFPSSMQRSSWWFIANSKIILFNIHRNELQSREWKGGESVEWKSKCVSSICLSNEYNSGQTCRQLKNFGALLQSKSDSMRSAETTHINWIFRSNALQKRWW